MRTRCDGIGTRGVAIRAIHHGVFRRKRGTPWCPRRFPAYGFGRVHRWCQRIEPAALVRPVANGGDNEQVAGACGCDIRQTLRLGLLARTFFLTVQYEVGWRPASELQGTHPLILVEPATGFGRREPACGVGQNDDRELEALSLVNGHNADAIAALFKDRRL